MSDTYFNCPYCGREDWIENINYLPDEWSYECAYCGKEFFIFIVTAELAEKIKSMRTKPIEE